MTQIRPLYTLAISTHMHLHLLRKFMSHWGQFVSVHCFTLNFTAHWIIYIFLLHIRSLGYTAEEPGLNIMVWKDAIKDRYFAYICAYGRESPGWRSLFKFITFFCSPRRSFTAPPCPNRFKIDYVIVIKDFLYPEGHQNLFNGSKVMAI